MYNPKVKVWLRKAMSCYQVMQALKDCQRKHPKEANGAINAWPTQWYIATRSISSLPYLSGICQHLTSAAGWCIFQSICPTEGRSLEDCVGVSNIRTVSHIPTRCSEREELLSACLEGQRQAADDRTAACPSKKKKQHQSASASTETP